MLDKGHLSMKTILSCLLFTLTFTGCGYTRYIYIYSDPDPTAISYTNATDQFQAATAKVDITPNHNVWLAGYHPGRKSTGIHDPIEARIVILQDTKGFSIAVVSVDMLGFLKNDTDALRKRLSRIKHLEIFVLSSHNHSSPDLIGIYGPTLGRIPLVSGRDEAYITQSIEKISHAIEMAMNRLTPVVLSFSRSSPEITESYVEEPDHDFDIWNIEKIIDSRLEPLALIVVAGCHPTTLIRSNTLITSDFPGVMRDILDRELQTNTLFINSAPGGVTYGKRSRAYNNFKRRAAVGHIFAREVLNTNRALFTRLEPKPFRFATTSSRLPMTNPLFILGSALGFIPNDGWLSRTTEVSTFTIGDITVVTVPGELFPSISREIKSKNLRITEIWSLANDEIGYILREKDFDKEEFRYWHGVSLGPDTGTIILKNAQKALQAVHQ